jgi:hypothetical protein
LKLYHQLDRGFAEEMAVHHRYNINTNFDVIEIGGDYDRAVREAINLALQELVQEHSVDEKALEHLRDVLGLYDPTDVLVRRVLRPAGVTWIDKELSDEQFIGFTDIGGGRERFVQRDERWVTLYENTEQRIGDRLGADQTRATKVRVNVFGIAQGSPAPTLHEIEAEARGGALAPLRNRYRFELACMELAGSQSLPEFRGRLIPLVQVSRISFRGRHSSDIASVVPGLAKQLGLERHSGDVFGYTFRGEHVVQSIEWQEAFDQGRRRHEPKSSGFLLQMDRGLLSRWADTRGVELWTYLIIERTTDRDKPESQMEWRVHTDVLALPLL